MATRAPSLSNSCAAANPIPLLPPVIRMFLSVSLPIVVTPFGRTYLAKQLHNATTMLDVEPAIMMQLVLEGSVRRNMRRKSFKDDLCPAARSLDSIGEWWSLLIVRNALLGMRRFSDFQEDLGLAKNILSARLKKLVACGIMKQVPASDGSAYQEYVLTKKGRDLLPVIVALRQWGENYLFSRREKRLQIVDKRTLKPPRRLDVQNVKGDALAPNDLELVTVTTRLAV